MWTLQPHRSICALHQAPCHACHECITNLKRQRIRFALNSHTYFEGSKKRKTIFTFICVFFVLHSCGPVFLCPVASLDPGELPVVFLECTSAGNKFSHFSLFCLIFPHLGTGGFSGYRILVVFIPHHHCHWVPGSDQYSPFPFGFRYWFQWGEWLVLFVWGSLGSWICIFNVSHHIWTLFSHSFCPPPRALSQPGRYLLIYFLFIAGSPLPCYPTSQWISYFRYCIFQFWNFLVSFS